MNGITYEDGMIINEGLKQN